MTFAAQSNIKSAILSSVRDVVSFVPVGGIIAVVRDVIPFVPVGGIVAVVRDVVPLVPVGGIVTIVRDIVQRFQRGGGSCSSRQDKCNERPAHYESQVLLPCY